VQPSTGLVMTILAKEKIHADSETDADEILKNLALTIEQRGNDVTARAKYEEPQPSFHFGSWPPVQVDFIVTVPASFAADLKTSGGDIAVEGLGGALRAHTSGGDIELGRIGGDVDASTSGGNVSLAEGCATVSLRTSGGNVSVGRAAGPTTLETSGGNVEAGISGPIKGDCSLKTSGGRVIVAVDRAAGFDLDAATSGGRINADDLTIAIAKGGLRKSRLEGSVNGGGPLISLRSSGGDIEVRTH
jgi:hypothetical protein